MSIYIICEIGFSDSNNSYHTLEISLIGAVQLTESTDLDKYLHSGYGIWFDGIEIFHFLVVDLAAI